MQSFLSNFLRRIVLYLWFAFIFSVITSSLFPHYITLNIYNYYIYTYLKTQLLLTLQKLNSLWQERRKVDNWGGGADIHIFMFCIIYFLWKRLFLQSAFEYEYMNISPAPNYRLSAAPGLCPAHVGLSVFFHVSYGDRILICHLTLFFSNHLFFTPSNYLSNRWLFQQLAYLALR